MLLYIQRLRTHKRHEQRKLASHILGGNERMSVSLCMRWRREIRTAEILLKNLNIYI